MVRQMISMKNFQIEETSCESDVIKLINSGVKDDIIVEIFNSHVRAIQFLKPENWSYRLAEIVATKYPKLFGIIPTEFVDNELCLMAFSKDIASIVFFPKEYISLSMYITVLTSYDANLIHMVPDELRIKEVWQACILNNISYTRIVPREYIDEEICFQSLENTPKHFKPNVIDFIDFIPEEYRSERIYRKLIEYSYIKLDKIPNELKTKELYEYAAKCDYAYITQIPHEYITREMVLNILADYHNKNGYISSFVINISQSLLSYIPNEIIDYNICLESVKCGCSLIYVPKQFITKELVLEFVKQAPGFNYHLIPSEFKDDDDIICAIINDVTDAFMFINPAKLTTKRQIAAFLKRNINLINIIPEQMIDEDVLLEYARANVDLVDIIPQKLISKKIALLFVRRQGLQLMHVPDDIKTIDVCVAAVRQNIEALEFVPDDLIEKVKQECSELFD